MKIYPQNLILKNIIEIEKKKIRKEKKKKKNIIVMDNAT
jgi:hypothetical protein